jgi:cell wall-associated NlpC family hydrolase
MVVTLAAGSFTTGVEAASSTAGFSSYNANILSATITPTAGVSTTLSALLSDDAEDEILAEAQAQIRENETPVVTSEYADIAIAQVNNYVNVRSEANADSEVLGKLYNNSAATVLEVDGDWYLINSGSVTGYVKAEYVVVGDEELARSVSRRVATVTTETLKVRTEAGLDASVLGLVPEGDDLTVVDESIDGWVGVSMEEGEGYVSTDYVTLSTEYIYAESKAEEEARLAKEEAARKAAAAAAAAKSSSSSSSASSSSSSATTSYSAPSGSDGQAVVDYACQFVGNPYKYGGSSLTNGTDCSGFVMSVYAAFGVSLPHSSKSMRSVGYGVSVDEMQPGDIICYSGHVAIYVGNNTIVHASTPSTGIKYTSPANYKTILAVRRIF